MATHHQPLVRKMIKDLYADLRAPQDWMTDEKIAATFKRFESDPKHLRIEVFEVDDKIAGYSILFDFWYNEFGGMVLNIDELYIVPEFRSNGLASMYIEKLAAETEYKALSLEASPHNKRAFALYKKLGFEEKETRMLYKVL